MEIMLTLAAFWFLVDNGHLATAYVGGIMVAVATVLNTVLPAHE